jgi:superfamily II DNA or RNA helicase
MAHILSDKIYIDFYNSNLTAEIMQEFSYDNPEYYAKMNMGISVRDVPKVINTYTFKNGILAVARGEIGKLVKADPSLEMNVDFPNVPIQLQYINDDFDLDEYQNEAVEVLKIKRQGVVHAVTSAGKSLMILKAICEIGQRALIVVHLNLLKEQFLQDIEKYVRDKDGNKIKVGIIGGGKYSIGDITIAMDKSLSKYVNEVNDKFGVLFMDECHIAPATTLFHLINSIKTERRYGFSGTLERKDGKQFLIFSTFGKVIYTISKSQLLDKKRVVPVRLEIIESEALFDRDSVMEDLGPTRTHQILEEYLMNHPERNKLILEAVSKMPGKTIVLSKRVDPCYNLSKQMKDEYGIDSGIITGKNAEDAVEAYNKMKHGDLRLIFATVGCVSTGISISDLDNLVLISPIYTNTLLLHQIRGRLMRNSPGKTEGVFWFIYDHNIFHGGKLREFINIIKE